MKTIINRDGPRNVTVIDGNELPGGKTLEVEDDRALELATDPNLNIAILEADEKPPEPPTTPTSAARLSSPRVTTPSKIEPTPSDDGDEDEDGKDGEK